MDRTKIDYVGVLASDEEMEKIGTGRYAVFINANDVLQFNIKNIAQIPDESPHSKAYIGYSNKFPEFRDTNSFDENVRIDAYCEELENWFIGFNFKENYNNFSIIEKIMKIERLPSYKPDNTYIPVPTYRAGDKIEGDNTNYETLDDLLVRLKERKYLGKVEGIVNDKTTPEYLIWVDREDNKYAVGQFNSHNYAHGGFCFDYDQLKYIEFEEGWYDEIFGFRENRKITYVESETSKEIILKLITEEPIDVIERSKEELRIPEMLFRSEEQISEKTLIDQFELIAKSEGLYYDRKDLINFHTSVKTNSLVILSGMSGTGKSRLVRCYAKALGIADDGFKVIPVRPSWNDDSDLLGFVDSMHMVYRPSDNGFVNFLLDATDEKNKEKLYIVCLDEMNLARVEHYFSQFLSILEMPEKSRKLELYDVDSRLYNFSKYKQEIILRDNIKFVGTVNIDESTFHFSDKVLDRANVIKLNVVPYFEWDPITPADKASIMQNNWTYSRYQDFVKKENVIPLSDRERLFIWEVHNLFNQVNRNLGVGPRVIRKIDSYLENLPEDLELTRQESFDIQFVQRVLTKLRGSREQLQDILADENEAGSSIFNLIDGYGDVSDFTRTKKILSQKKQELRVYGYTL